MKELFNQLPLCPVFFAGGEEFETLRDAAMHIKDLTLNRNYRVRNPVRAWGKDYAREGNLIIKGTFRRPTIFNEISTGLKDHDMQDTLKKKGGKESINVKKLAAMAVEKLYGSLKAAWPVSKTKLMTHSSGFDSRIVSGLFRQLKKDLGDDFGQVAFVCWPPDNENFQRLANYYEWSDVHIVGEGLIDCFKPAIDFEKIGLIKSGITRNWLGPILSYDVLKDKYVDATGLTGLYGDEILRTARQDITFVKTWAEFTACYMMESSLSVMYGGKPFLALFTTKPYLDLLSRYKVSVHPDKFKLHMLREINPILANQVIFPNARFEGARFLKRFGYRKHFRLSDDTVSDMISSFKSSWYGKNKNIKFDKTIKAYDPKLSEYFKAAICESLINAGCNINETM